MPIRLLVVCLMFCATPACVAEVVINEIFYHAPDDIEQLEWIELHNTADEAVDLSGWQLKGVSFTFPKGTKMEPKGFLVLTRHQKLFEEFYEAKTFGEFKGALSNRGETVELLDAQGMVVDRVTYADAGPWPVAPDGYSASLEKMIPGEAGDNPRNWSSSKMAELERLPAGTPGAENSSRREVMPPKVKVQASPAWEGQPIDIEITVDEADDLKTVELLYQVVAPGKVGAEQSVPVEPRDGGYRAAIPAQPRSTLVRYRVRTTDKHDATSYLPHPHALRPAYSTFVLADLDQANIPLAFIINTDPAQVDAMRGQLKTTQHVGNDRGAIFQQYRMSQMIAARLDVSANWFELTIRHPLTEAEYEVAKAAVMKLDRDKRSLLARATQGDDDAVRDISLVRRNFFTALEAGISKEKVRAVRSASSARRVSRRDPKFIVHELLALESNWFELSARFEMNYESFQPMKRAFEDAWKSKTELLAEEGRTSRSDLQERALAIRTKLDEQIGFRHRRYLLDLKQNRGSFIRPNFAGLALEPPRGRSAFIVFDADKKQAEVFDFVNVFKRSAGFKVRFHRDQLYRGMSSANIIFEYRDRFVLAEPLAFDVYRRAGSPACQTEFIRLDLDGEMAGYHLLFEHINGSFIRRNGRENGGDLYKILWYGRDLVDQHQRKGDPEGGHEELIRLVGQLNDTEGDEQWEVIKKHFDVEQVARYFAVNSVLSHWDGFFNNYFTYRDPKTGKWQMYAWDQDKTWGYYDGLSTNQDFTNMPLTFGMRGDRPSGGGFRRGNWWRPGGHFSSPLLANPTFRKVFLGEVTRILDDIYSEEAYYPVIEELAEKLRPEISVRADAIGEDREVAMQRFDDNIASLKRHLRKRREFLLGQDELKQLAEAN